MKNEFPTDYDGINENSQDSLQYYYWMQEGKVCSVQPTEIIFGHFGSFCRLQSKFPIYYIMLNVQVSYAHGENGGGVQVQYAPLKCFSVCQVFNGS